MKKTILISVSVIVIGLIAVCFFRPYAKRFSFRLILGRVPEDPRFYGKTVFELQNDLSDKDINIRCHAAEMLAELIYEDWDGVSDTAKANLKGLQGPELQAALPVLIVALQKKEGHSAFLAAEIFSTLGAEAKEAIPYLIQVFEKGSLNGGVQFHCARALGNMGPLAKDSVPLLIRFMETDEDAQAYYVPYALAEITGKEAIPTLLDAAIHGRNTHIRQQSCATLGRFPEEASRIVPILIVALQDESELVREQAIQSLAKFGDGAQIAAPELRKLFKDEAPRVRKEAVAAICVVSPGDVETLTSLNEGLGDKDLPVRIEAACSLLHYQPEDERSLSLLLEIIRTPLDRNDWYRDLAAQGLARFPNGSKRIVPALIQALDDPVDQMRASAARALGDIGINAREAIPRLIKATDEQSFKVRDSASEALRKMSAAPDQIASLLGLLGSGGGENSLLAAITLPNPGLWKSTHVVRPVPLGTIKE
jgi:HEAT repeat protein